MNRLCGSCGLGSSVTRRRLCAPTRIRPMREKSLSLALRHRPTPRYLGERSRPSLRCAVVIETLPLFAEGLVRLLHELADIRMVSTAASFTNFRTLLARLKPELVVLDLDARETRPVDAARLVRQHAEG